MKIDFQNSKISIASFGEVNQKNNHKISKIAKVIILSEEEAKKSKISFVKFAKENLDFSAKLNQSNLVSFEETAILLVGMGVEKKIDNISLQKIGSKIISHLNAAKIKKAELIFPTYLNNNQIANIAFGAKLQSYRFNKYFENKKENKELKVKELILSVSDQNKARSDFREFEILAENIFLTRDLVSEPSNNLNPESYAEICKNLKKDGLEVEILGEAEMKKLAMHSLLGVGQGSEKESKMVIFKWNGGKKGDTPIAFVGKGVTFDTGGISIKPSNNMEDMKTDMAGSAVVVGLMRNLAQRKAKINVIGAIGLVENMPSGTAQRPGDVVRSMSGQTIEVINTDAEGRLVLADVLHYTNIKFKPKFIVDLATLTGAIIVALGDVYAGLFSNDDELSKQLEICGNKTGEKVWRFPISEEYDEMINSDIADMKNVGSNRGAGSITAAQFLHRFIGKTKWAHLDIAGVAWRGKGDAMAIKGASGYGVRLLNELVKIYEKK
jgi:leucyl aminopeptidase